MKLCIIGAGTFGTAIANVIASKKNTVLLYSIEREVVRSINDEHVNSKYFPGIKLNSHITATLRIQDLANYPILFVAIPSSAILDSFLTFKNYLNPHSLIVNLSKGFGKNNKTIYETLQSIIPNPLASLKGPSFARELIHGLPTSLTFASNDFQNFEVIQKLFLGSRILVDYTDDILGVELVSAMKNIYAIIVGIVDALFNSANVRFLVLCNAINEMRSLLKLLNAKDDTLFKYCGIGDLALTSLNDLSRNRTLGLLIGKGFYSKSMKSSVVLEGIRSIQCVLSRIPKDFDLQSLMITKLDSLFRGNLGVEEFVDSLFEIE